MDYDKNIILDLCGGTGAWSKPYRNAGNDVRLLTLPKFDITRTVIDNFQLVFPHQIPNEGSVYSGTYLDVRNICGILAAPPCTEFSIAKGARPRDLKKGMETVNACMKIIHHCQIFDKLQFWALENPRGLLRRFLGIPKYTFEQWQFGGNKRKHTDIWGYFKPPKPTVKKFPVTLVQNDGRNRAHAADWARLEYPPEYADYIKQFHGDERRAAARAITPSGFAEAFYRANKPIKERK